MSKVKPWLYGLLGSLRLAEEFVQSGEDFGRRWALISYDNTIELAIATFLDLHPDQRGGKTFKKEDVARWKTSFHEKIRFFEEYVIRAGKPVQVTRADFVHYHRQRNKFYHEDVGSVPLASDVHGVRRAALWVVSTLFEIDAEELLRQEIAVPPPMPQEQPIMSKETPFLEGFIEMRRDLDMLLRVTGLVDPSDETIIDSRQAWDLLASQSHGLPKAHEETIRRAESLSDRLFEDESPPQSEEFDSLTSEIKEVSKLIDTQLRDYQHRIVGNAVTATLRASPEKGGRRAGIVWQTMGSGLTTTLLHYIARITESSDFETVIIVTDSLALCEQLFASFSSADTIPLPRVEYAKSAHHLSRLLDEEDGVIITTIQKFYALMDLADAEEAPFRQMPALSERADILIVAYNVLSLGAHMASLIEAFPNATRILFTSIPVEADSGSLHAFGNLVGSYNLQQAIRDGFVVPILLETRSFATLGTRDNAVTVDADRSEYRHPERVHLLAQDFVDHFESRLKVVDGKGMIVVPDRVTAINLYSEISHLRPDWHSEENREGVIKVIMTGSYRDPPEWQQYILNGSELQMLADIFRDPDSRLKAVITSGLWLTGIDIPPLHTLYIYRPMQRRALRQAMARVSRVFEGKQNGLIVDYWGGLADKFEQALEIYEKGMSESAIDE